MSSNKNILSSGKSVIKEEATALLELSEIISESFTLAVKTILEIEKHGHVIISGMGKAGLIGSKISATLASIGTASFFLHPAEALHGDLGRYKKSDIALILSNSGETEEILKNILAIKNIGCPIIAITASSDNTLAKHSDIVIPIGKSNEAGKLGLAPTTSTTKMLAIGDALAICIMEQKGISAEDFAFYHPGGSLGKSLISVSEIMRTGDMFCCLDENTKMKDVIHAYNTTKGRPGAAVLTSGDKKLSGIFTDGDLRRCLEKGFNFLDDPVKNLMGRNPKTIYSDTLANEALKIMSKYKIDQIVVVNSGNEPLGILDIQDLII